MAKDLYSAGLHLAQSPVGECRKQKPKEDPLFRRRVGARIFKGGRDRKSKVKDGMRDWMLIEKYEEGGNGLCILFYRLSSSSSLSLF